MASGSSFEENAALVRLIEEGLFLSHADRCGIDNKDSTMSKDHRYLVEQVFPTLVPGLCDLLKCYKNRVSETGELTISDNKHPDPVVWLAQYLIRNNTHHNFSRLAKHPFQLINNAVLNDEQGGELMDD